MKAVNFLEWVSINRKSGFHKKSYHDFLVDTLDKIADVSDFYSQPFKPEMITELFEGTKQTIKDGWKWMYKSENNRAIYFAVNFTESHQYTISGYGWTKPQTLNDFISDCNRAGIELNWKPEIITKYFS
jgi:hypothetical protein